MWLWWWLLFCVLVGTTFTFISIRRARSNQTNPKPVVQTGTVLTPVAVTAPSATWRRIGGGIVVGSFGKVTATWPLAVLEVRPGGLVLRLRPRFLGAAFGGRPIEASVQDAVVFPARGFFGSGFVGIKTSTDEGYFGASDQSELLGSLHAAGFTVEWAERKITYP